MITTITQDLTLKTPHHKFTGQVYLSKDCTLVSLEEVKQSQRNKLGWNDVLVHVMMRI